MRAIGFVGGTHLHDIRSHQTQLLKSAGASEIFECLLDVGDAILHKPA
jgi:hypothetical protein